MPSAEGQTVESRLVDRVRKDTEDVVVRDVRIGLGYTAVRLADDRTGVALTFRREGGDGCAVFQGRRPLAGRPAGEIAPLLASGDPVEAAVGLACVNALYNTSTDRHAEGDVLDALAIHGDDRVGMVGRFGPLLAPVRERAGSLTVFERIAEPAGDLRPAAEAPAVLPTCSLALITGSTLVNHTLDGLLSACNGCRDVVVLGASTPLVPEAFAGTAVSVLAGVVVTDTDAVLRVVSEGGGMRHFKPYIRKTWMRLQPATRERTRP